MTFATAPTNMGQHLLGRPVDEHFRPISGPEGASLFGEDGSAIVEIPVDAFRHERTVIETVGELAAHADAWGVVSADIGVGMSKRYAVFGAYQAEYMLTIDDTTPMRTAPQGAAYYLSAIYFGHSCEMVFVGDSSTFTAEVKADFLVARGEISAWAEQHRLEARYSGRGMSPVDGSAIWSFTPEDMTASYVTDGDAVPIFVEYRTIPAVIAPAQVPFEWVDVPPLTYDVLLEQVEFAGSTSTCVDKVRWRWPPGTVGAIDSSWSRRSGCHVVRPGAVMARRVEDDLAGVTFTVEIDDYEWINQYWRDCAVRFTQHELDKAAQESDGTTVTRTCQDTMVMTFRIIAREY